MIRIHETHVKGGHKRGAEDRMLDACMYVRLYKNAAVEIIVDIYIRLQKHPTGVTIFNCY